MQEHTWEPGKQKEGKKKNKNEIWIKNEDKLRKWASKLWKQTVRKPRKQAEKKYKIN